MRFLKQAQVDFPVLIDQDGKVSNEYEIFAFPSSFLINAEGRLSKSVNTAIEWDDAEIKHIIRQIISEEVP
ncbi:redoxin domain-containing protein [Thiomicrorhabdus sp. Milos-T2]|uniref:peroxiredoxin family protein n=1 Tax=Thiomicrorhabdus sp. Milos-T2 TaxID=90814 RepID=UPI000494040D